MKRKFEKRGVFSILTNVKLFSLVTQMCLLIPCNIVS